VNRNFAGELDELAGQGVVDSKRDKNLDVRRIQYYIGINQVQDRRVGELVETRPGRWLRIMGPFGRHESNY
jgi:hypothetical protein